MTRSVSSRRPRDEARFPTARHELTDNEIETLYGAYIRASIPKLAQADCLTDMVEAANQIIRKRELADAARARAKASV